MLSRPATPWGRRASIYVRLHIRVALWLALIFSEAVARRATRANAWKANIVPKCQKMLD
jgi:hypothetical protein